MAVSTDSDTNILTLGLLAVITLIPGLVIHSFIIGTNVNDWWKGRSVTSVDHIVTSLGVSRLCAQCALTLYVLVDIVFQSSLQSHVILIIDAFHVFFSYTNIWLTTLLSIVFCLKISNLCTRLFLYLRRVILPRTGHFIVASLILSAFICLMIHTETTDGRTYNITMNNRITNCIYISAVYIFSIGGSISLLCSFTSSVLLFSSLYHHTVKMKRSSKLSINLETYYSAMKFVSFTFIYNTTFHLSHFVSAYYYFFNCLDFTCLHIVLGFQPILHSSYLIYRTAKLRSQMSKVLQNVIDFIFQKQ